MNTCMTITCTTCEQDTDCRIGYSNRMIQPLQFSCPHCHSSLEITLDISNAPKSKFSFNGCNPSKNPKDGPFDGANPFVDLHLDFPVKFGTYVMGLTPWFASLNQLNEVTGDGEKSHQLSMFHTHRLNILNELYPKSEDLKRVINLYHGANKQLFQKRAAEFLGEKQEQSTLQQDLNATLYRVLAKAFVPFIVFEHSKEISEELPKLLFALDREQLGLFIEDVYSSGFLTSLQRDCLRIYPRVFEVEIPFRPALFLDLFEDDQSDLVAARVSSQDFFRLKDLYKDILEVIARQIVLIAGINNLYHRGNYNSFKAIDGGALSSLQKLSEKTLSDKFKYLDDSWYNLAITDLNLGLRNAIAHNNINYNSGTQTIKYYPEGGRLAATKGIEISFLAFMRFLLLAFREMHNLHHVIKSLYYYKLLIHDRSAHEQHERKN